MQMVSLASTEGQDVLKSCWIIQCCFTHHLHQIIGFLKEQHSGVFHVYDTERRRLFKHITLILKHREEGVMKVHGVDEAKTKLAFHGKPVLLM